MNSDSSEMNLAKVWTEDPTLLELFHELLLHDREGHLCLDLAVFDKSKQDAYEKALFQSPLVCIENKTPLTHAYPFYLSETRLYLHKTYFAEVRFKQALERFHGSLKRQSGYLIPSDPNLLEKQNEAIKKALEPGMLLLTGGPGTGKTYSAEKIARACLEVNRHPSNRIILSAPTAKAVEQLKKNFTHFSNEIQIVSGTLHRLLDFRRKGPSYLDASCIIIDECSMIEAPLFAKLFESLASGTKLILMGDPAQLPPVGSGSFFQDLLEVKSYLPNLHHVHLNQTQRFSNPHLLHLAELSLKGESGAFIHYLNEPHPGIERIFKPLNGSNASFFETLLEFFKDHLFCIENLEKLEWLKTQSIILSTLRQGPHGVDQINERLSAYFFDQSKDFPYFIEPIILTESSPQLKLSNGQTGHRIYCHKTGVQFFTLHGVQYSISLFPKYKPGYALSVHKSQGSEYDHVLFMIPEGSERFSREIIYTAITRVKKTLQIWLDELPLKEAMSKQNKRTSGLLKRFRSTVST